MTCIVSFVILFEICNVMHRGVLVSLCGLTRVSLLLVLLLLSSHASWCISKEQRPLYNIVMP